jgi:excisionase family DNA binding protein
VNPDNTASEKSAPRNAVLLLDLVASLVRSSIVDAVPVLVTRLAPALVDVIARSFRESAPGIAATYVTVKAAAAIMGCHPTTIRRLVREGKLGRYLLEKDLRIKVSDIHAYMARAGTSSPSIDLAERALSIMGVRRPGGDGRD